MSNYESFKALFVRKFRAFYYECYEPKPETHLQQLDDAIASTKKKTSFLGDKWSARLTSLKGVTVAWSSNNNNNDKPQNFTLSSIKPFGIDAKDVDAVAAEVADAFYFRFKNIIESLKISEKGLFRLIHFFYLAIKQNYASYEINTDLLSVSDKAIYCISSLKDEDPLFRASTYSDAIINKFKLAKLECRDSNLKKWTIQGAIKRSEAIVHGQTDEPWSNEGEENRSDKYPPQFLFSYQQAQQENLVQSTHNSSNENIHSTSENDLPTSENVLPVPPENAVTQIDPSSISSIHNNNVSAIQKTTHRGISGYLNFESIKRMGEKAAVPAAATLINVGITLFLAGRYSASPSPVSTQTSGLNIVLKL